MLQPGRQCSNIEIVGRSVELEHPGGGWLVVLDDVEILRDLQLGSSLRPDGVPAGFIVFSLGD